MVNCVGIGIVPTLDFIVCQMSDDSPPPFFSKSYLFKRKLMYLIQILCHETIK